MRRGSCQSSCCRARCRILLRDYITLCQFYALSIDENIFSHSYGTARGTLEPRYRVSRRVGPRRESSDRSELARARALWESGTRAVSHTAHRSPHTPMHTPHKSQQRHTRGVKCVKAGTGGRVQRERSCARESNPHCYARALHTTQGHHCVDNAQEPV